LKKIFHFYNLPESTIQYLKVQLVFMVDPSVLTTSHIFRLLWSILKLGNVFLRWFSNCLRWTTLLFGSKEVSEDLKLSIISESNIVVRSTSGSPNRLYDMCILSRLIGSKCKGVTFKVSSP